LTIIFFGADILPAILFEKFELSLPSAFQKSMYVHLPQLLNAIVYHAGVVLRLSSVQSLGCESNPRPFCVEDVQEILSSSKYSITYPGLFYTVDTMAEAFLACNMYSDATKAYKIRLSLHEIFRSFQAKPSMKMRYESTLVAYNLALCYYLSRKYDAASAILRTELDGCNQSTPVTARLVTLLMCVDYCAGRLADSMKHYETARGIYIECLGPRHPMVCLMFTTLSDLYFGSDSLKHAHVMTLKAVDFCDHFVGESHVLYGSCAYKLGVVLVKLGAYKEAEEMLQKSFLVYSSLSSRGAEFSNEQSMCLHGLAIIQNALENVDGAVDFAVKSLALSTAEDKYVTTHAVNCILLLAELYEKKNLMAEAADLYADAWDVVCAYPKDYNFFKMLLVLASRIMSTHINSLPLHARMLLESVAADSDEIKKQEWDATCSYVINLLLEKSPIGYIGDLVTELLEDSNPGTIVRSVVLVSYHLLIYVAAVLSSQAFANQSSVVGVPCAATKR
jgi:tetratricopeptide (TPR) repeat protein